MIHRFLRELVMGLLWLFWYGRPRLLLLWRSICAAYSKRVNSPVQAGAASSEVQADG